MTATADPIIQIAERLAAARRDGTLVDLDLEAEIQDLQTAWAVQAAAVAAYGDRRIGYKIGATSAEVQAKIGCDAPFFAPLFAGDVQAPGAVIPIRPDYRAIECEFAFKMARDFPGPGEQATPEAAAEAVAACHPALEIIGNRIGGTPLPGLRSAVADFGANAGFIPGAAINNWRDLDLAQHEVRGLVDGRETNSGIGANVLGSPLNALAWLAGALAEAGSGLAAGDIISTGTCLGIIPIHPGHTITGDYGASGSVSVTFAAA